MSERLAVIKEDIVSWLELELHYFLTDPPYPKEPDSLDPDDYPAGLVV